MTKLVLKSIKRDLFGRKVKRLRNEGLIPANILGKNVKSHSISVDLKEFVEIYKKAGETQIIDLEGKSALVSKVQLDPISDQIIHVDFRQVDLKEKLSAHVPVVLIGESPAEKQGLGTVVQQIYEIEVEALPTDLPEKIEIDSSILLEVDQSIFVKDLKVSKDVEIKSDLDLIVVKVEPPQKEEVVVEIPIPTETTTDTTKPESAEVENSKTD